MADVLSRRSIVYDITFNSAPAKKGSDDAEKALRNVDKAAKNAGSAFTDLGKQIAAAFTLQEAARSIAQFAKEAFQLGLKAEGVSKAFNALNDPNLLGSLRRATKGAVDDLSLMQAAVRADKFKIPLNQLATLFKFAAQRAKETGQEVNFLTDSIIDGIGRKSPLILDNLGIRAQDLQQEFAKTGDFAQAAANIISREMQNSGTEVESNAEKVAKLATAWENVKIATGAFLVDNLDKLKAIGLAIPGLNTNIIAIQALLDRQDDANKNAEDRVNALNAGLTVFKSLAPQALNAVGFSLAEIQDRLKELNEEFANATDDGRRKEIAATIFRFQEMEEAIKKLLDPMKAFNKTIEENIIFGKIEPGQITEGAFRPTIETLNTLEAKLAALQAQFKDTFTGAPEFEALKSEIAEVEERIKDLTGTNEQLKRSLEGIGADLATIFGNLASFAKQGSDAQIAFSIANIIAANAEALAKAISAAAGIPFPGNIPAILSSVATVTSTFAQVNAILAQARAAQSNASNAAAFAEGEVDIHRPGETRGKDSIPAIIMPGESVLTTQRTREYKPLIQAIHAGTVDEMIRVNYVEPALALQSLSGSKSDVIPDYSDRLYRQFLATGEGNQTGRRMLNTLISIDKKLTDRKPRYH